MSGFHSLTGRVSWNRATLVSLFALPLLALDAGPAAGQAELTVEAGMYAPTTSVFLSTMAVGPSGLLELWHQPAPLVGAKLTIWPSHRFGLEAATSLTFGGVTEARYFDPPLPPGSDVFSLFRRTTPGTVVTGSARGLFRILLWQATSVHLIGGVGFVRRDGHAYDIAEGTTSPMLVTGLGLRSRLTPRLAVRMAVEDQLSLPRIGIRSDDTASEPSIDASQRLLQADLAFTLGLSMSLWR